MASLHFALVDTVLMVTVMFLYNQESAAANVDVKERAELWSTLHCSRTDSLPMDPGKLNRLMFFIYNSMVFHMLNGLLLNLILFLQIFDPVQ